MKTKDEWVKVKSDDPKTLPRQWTQVIVRQKGGLTFTAVYVNGRFRMISKTLAHEVAPERVNDWKYSRGNKKSTIALWAQKNLGEP